MSAYDRGLSPITTKISYKLKLLLNASFDGPYINARGPHVSRSCQRVVRKVDKSELNLTCLEQREEKTRLKA